MAAYLYSMLIHASVLAHDARYIAHARTLVHRTCPAALSMLPFVSCTALSVDQSEQHLKIYCLVLLEPVNQHGGQV